MTDRIEPALSAEEWAEEMAARPGRRSAEEMVGADPAECAYLIACNNNALPDSDSRKITRAMADSIRDAADWIDGAYDAPSLTEERKPWIAELKRFADALASYLPPEPDISPPSGMTPDLERKLNERL